MIIIMNDSDTDSTYVSVGAGVRRVSMHPKEGSWVVSAVNGNNEISMWDMETQSRHMTLWASPKPPLSMTQVGQSFFLFHLLPSSFTFLVFLLSTFSNVFSVFPFHIFRFLVLMAWFGFHLGILESDFVSSESHLIHVKKSKFISVSLWGFFLGCGCSCKLKNLEDEMLA